MGAHHADILPSTDAEQLVDFTCATPWERLSLDIELQLRTWHLHDARQPDPATIRQAQLKSSPHAHTDNSSTSQSPISPLPIATAPLTLADASLSLQIRTSPANGWLHSHPLERLFGVHHYLLLTAATPDGIVADDASDAAVLLSALTVAASAAACALPLFVPVGRPASLRFIGRQLSPSPSSIPATPTPDANTQRIATPSARRFSCDFVHHPADTHTHLAGLLALFRNKRASARPHAPPAPPAAADATIVAHFTYNWTDFSFKLTPAPQTFAFDRRLAAVQTPVLTSADPIRRIRISAVWDDFPASDLQRNHTLAGMPAATASRLRLSPASDLVADISDASFPSVRIPMSVCARANLRLAQMAFKMESANDPAAPLPLVDVQKCLPAGRGGTGRTREDLSADPSSSLHDFLVQVGEYVSSAAIQDDDVDEEFLTSAMAALFEMDLGRGIMVDVVDALGPNGAEMGVLERVARLAAVSETLDATHRLWNLFLDGLQVHWERLWIVAGVPFSVETGPDHDASLVVQKVQMINCCVERLRRERRGGRGGSRMKGTVKVEGDDGRGEGRKTVLDGVDLIGALGSGDGEGDGQVWEPFVQPHPLATRDMVEEELQRMVMRAEASNGNDDDMEAKRQSLTLRSDMMAFKAANPDAVLADFVRWFSPSDWVDENAECMGAGVGMSNGEGADGESSADGEGGVFVRRRGRLSARMSRQGNIWEELWDGAEGVPASRQVPLFDAAAHGNKALADLRAMPLGQVLVHLALIQSGCACGVLQTAFERPPDLKRVCGLVEEGRQSVRDMCAKVGLLGNHGEVEMVGRSVERVAMAEHAALIATSVLVKLPPADGMGGIVDCLAVGEFVDVVEEREKQLVVRMAGLDDGGWRSVLLPEGREFVVSGGGGDRMYARLNGKEFRVAFRLALEYCV